MSENLLINTRLSLLVAHVKNVSIFCSYVKKLLNLPRVRYTEYRLVYANTFSSISQLYFLTETVKQN